MTKIDVPAILEVVRQRDLDCEGVPMVLMLRGASPAPIGDRRRIIGRNVARVVAAVHRQLEEAEAASSTGSTVLESDVDEVRAISSEQARVIEAVSVVSELVVGRLTNEDYPRLDELALSVETSEVQPGELLEEYTRALEEGRWITVVNYHNTPASTSADLADNLELYSRHYAPVGISELADLFATGFWQDARDPLLPVFYEGHRNNYEQGGPASEAAGLVAWFFLITGFVMAEPAEQITFARAHHIGLADEELGRDRIAMTWTEAAELARRHVVTSHTASHFPAHHLVSAEDYAVEVVTPTEQVRRATGLPSCAHAWLYGSAMGLDPIRDCGLRDAGYRWCFSNLAIDDVAYWANSHTVTA